MSFSKHRSPIFVLIVASCTGTVVGGKGTGGAGGGLGGTAGSGGVASGGDRGTGGQSGGGRAGTGGEAGSQSQSGGIGGTAGVAGGGGTNSADGGAATDPLHALATCTSGMVWTAASPNDPLMRPGEGCNVSSACHGAGAAAIWSVAGTIYPTGHEPNDCEGFSNTSSNGVGIVITDAMGGVLPLAPNTVGNFYYSGALAFPIQAKLISFATGAERAMVGPVSSGDCNSCHTQDGSSGAPGRLTVPF